MGLARKSLLWISENRTLRRRLPQMKFVRRAVSRFMPGEELADALGAAQKLKEKNLASLFTLLGENITDAALARKVAGHYLEALERIREAGLDGHISVKLTQLGLDLGEALCFENLTSIVRRAKEFGNWVWIDMEQSKYVDNTLALYKKARREYPKVGVCLQAYLYRTQKDLEGLFFLSPAIRLVKGAYSEPAGIAHPRKRDVDASYFELSKWLLENVKKHNVVLGIATHDKLLIRKIQQEAEALGLAKSDYELQMLYGIQSREQMRLAAEGHPVRTLISYGPHWFPWYLRRLAERPANVLFALKHLWRN